MTRIDSNSILDIVIPAFNAELYIIECVESLIKQYNSKFKIIIIDDGSSDKTSIICDNYCERFGFIEVYHTSNQGLTKAREYGVSKSSAEYITFIDSDDWVDDEYINKIFNYLDGGNDILIFNYFRNYNNKNFKVVVFKEKESLFYFPDSKDNVFLQMLVGPTLDVKFDVAKLDSLDSVCMKVYKRKLITSDCFVSVNEVGSGEDIIFNLVAFKNAFRFVYIPDCLYYYRKTNEQSLTKTYKDNFLNKWTNLYKLISIHSPNTPFFEELLKNRQYLSLLSYGLYLFNTNIPASKKKSLFKDSIVRGFYKSVSKLKKYRKVGFPYNFFYFVSYHKLWFLAFLFLFLGIRLKKVKK